jgi:uncharacterized protein YkwD
MKAPPKAADTRSMTTRALQAAILVATLAVLAIPAAASPAAGRTHVSMSALESGVLQQLNAIRTEHGLVPLRPSGRLTAAASQHSREMGADGYFEHSSADGSAFWKRIGRWYVEGSRAYWSVGENLLWSSPDVDPAAALQIWMNSPEHRANILAHKWREIGIAAVHVPDAPGTFHDLPVTIITTDFGVRR